MQAIGTVSALEKALSVATGDPYINYHARHVRIYAVSIAEEMNLSDELTEQIGTVALLHDLGKMGIPKHILSKPASLTEQERKIIEQHPIISTNILAPTGLFDHELQMIRHHHERFNGGGYPDGLKGKEIGIGARVIAVADVFDAMTSDRPYQEKRTYEDAVEEIRRCSKTWFDSEVVEAFLKTSEKHKSEWPLSNEDSLSSSEQEALTIQAE